MLSPAFLFVFAPRPLPSCSCSLPFLFAAWCWPTKPSPAAKPRNEGSATFKQQGPEGRNGPRGNGPYCLTLLCEPRRNQLQIAASKPPNCSLQAFKLQPPSFQNSASATAKHKATEGRTTPSACGCLCLTSLLNCQESRSKLQLQASKLQRPPPQQCLHLLQIPMHLKDEVNQADGAATA